VSSDSTTMASYIINASAIAFGALTMQEVGVVIGITLGVLTYATNVYFKIRKENRDRELHDKIMNDDADD